MIIFPLGGAPSPDPQCSRRSRDPTRRTESEPEQRLLDPLDEVVGRGLAQMRRAIGWFPGDLPSQVSSGAIHSRSTNFHITTQQHVPPAAERRFLALR